MEDQGNTADARSSRRVAHSFDLPPGIRWQVYLILRNEEEAHVEGKHSQAERIGDWTAIGRGYWAGHKYEKASRLSPSFPSLSLGVKEERDLEVSSQQEVAPPW
jgi:hypothetical protein